MAHGHDDPGKFSTYIKVFAVLIVLTVITVAVAQVNLGKANTLIAMLVATVKAVVVAIWFMHMNHESTLNRIVFASAFIFAFIFFGLTFMDVGTRVNFDNLFLGQ